MLEELCLLVIVGVGVYCDLKTRKIPNRLCAFGVCCGLMKAVLGIGVISPFESLAGIAIPVILLFWLYTLRVLGAGDIKLFCAIGAFVGVEIWKIICLSMIFGAAWGFVMVVRRIYRCAKAGNGMGILTEKLTKICFSIPIALGLLVYIFMEVLSGGIQAWNM